MRHLRPPSPRICYQTHLRDALEQHGLVAGALGEAERTDGLGALVLIRGEEVVEAVVAYVVEEPFAVSLVVSEPSSSCGARACPRVVDAGQVQREEHVPGVGGGRGGPLRDEANLHTHQPSTPPPPQPLSAPGLSRSPSHRRKDFWEGINEPTCMAPAVR